MATAAVRTTKKSHTATVARTGTFFRAAGSPAFFAPARKPGARPAARPGLTAAPTPARPDKAARPDKVPRTIDPALRLQPPVRPKPVRPAEDPAFTRVTGTVRATAKQKRAHAPAAAKAKEAQDAAVPPSGDIDAQAKAAKADTMEAQRPGTFNKAAFIAAVKAAIEAKSPKNLEEAADVRSGRTSEVKAEVKGLVTQGKDDQAGDIRAATEAAPDRSKAVPKPVTPMGPEPAGAAPRIAATGAVPKPAPPEQLNLAAGKHQADQEMTQADVTEPQLAESNEPQFQQALTDKKTAAAHADTAPAEYRDQEAQILAQGTEEASMATGAGVAGMQNARVGAFARLVAQKTRTKSADETRRAQVTAEIERIFTATESAVKAILDGIDPKVEKEFNAGESFARESFESYVAAKMSAYKRDRYGGVFGGARWAKDKLFGMPDAVNQFYVDGRALYLREMDRTISRVADIVGADLTAAKTRITQGRNEIAVYVKGLPKDLQKVGADAAKEIGSRFSELESSVDAKATALVDTLATKYVAARKSLDERIEALQAANKGLVDKAIGAIKAVIRTIREFISTMTSALARAAGVVGQIIKAPIKFLGNLIAGVKGGIVKFRDDFLGHLRRGLMSWLFGEVAEAGIELPKSFDLKGIIGFVAALLGLTWANVRSRIVKRIGERAMGAVEKGVEIFALIAREGVGGVWNLLAEKLGDVKEMIFSQVKDFVRDKIIVAGITWLIGLLNPAAAFIKACKLIIDIVMFFVRNAARIAKFVNTIIDSVADMVRGNVAAVVNKINDALGQMVPIIIGFLASLIGLGGIGKKVREILQKLQKPMNVAIDFVIDKGLVLAGPIIRGISAVSGAVKEKVAAGKEWVKGKVYGGDDSPEGKQTRLTAAMAAAQAVGRRFSGRGATRVVLTPLISVVRARYGLTSLELIEKGDRWGVRGTINPTAEETLEAQLLDPKYEEQFTEAVRLANEKLAAEPTPLSIAAADLPEARQVVAPTGRRMKGSLNKWVNDLYTYFRDPSPEPKDTTVRSDADAANPHLRLVTNRSQRFTRLQAQTIDTAQDELNEHYRPGAALGDRSSAYLVVAEQHRAGRGNPPVAIVAGTTHQAKCTRAVQLLRRLEPGLPKEQRDIVARERAKMELALTWAINHRDASAPERPLPPFAADLES